MKTTFYLARHGETTWNKEQRFQGQLDSELTALGRAQSKNLADMLNQESIDIILTSSLGRAVATATICQKALSASIEINPNLSERNLGDWQGKLLAQLKNSDSYEQILHQFSNQAPVGGESAITCAMRITKALVDSASFAPKKNHLVIFHGEALRCFLLSLGEQCKGNAYHLFKNGCLSKLVYDHHSKAFQYCAFK